MAASVLRTRIAPLRRWSPWLGFAVGLVLSCFFTAAASAQVARLAVAPQSVLSAPEAVPHTVRLFWEGLRSECFDRGEELTIRLTSEDGTAVGVNVQPGQTRDFIPWRGSEFLDQATNSDQFFFGFGQAVIDDDLGEADETFTFVVEPAGAAQKTVLCSDETTQTIVIPTLRVTITILNDDLLLDQIAGATPTQQSVGEVLRDLCNRTDLPPELRETCTDLGSLTEDEIRDALRELSPEQTATQGETSLGFTSVQQRNLFGRLTELRRGRRLSASGLSVQTPSGPLPLQRIFDAFGRGGSRSAGSEPQRGLLAPGGSVSTSSPGTNRAGGVEAFWPAAAFTPAAPQDDKDDEDTETPFEEQRRLGLFVSGLLGSGDRGTTDRQTGFEVDNVGVTAGVDYQFTPKVVFGGALGWSTLDADLAAGAGSQDSDGQSLSSYVLYQVPDHWFFEGTATYGRADFEFLRGIAFPGRPATARGETEGDQLGATLGGGIERVWGASTLEVYGRGSYIDATVDEYAESGAPGFNLGLSEQEVESMEGSLVLDYSRVWSTGKAVLIPALRASYLRQFKTDSRPLGAVFLGDPSGTVFSVPSDEPDESYFNAAIGLSATFGGGASFFVQVESDLDRDDLELWVASMGFRVPLG